MVEINFLHGELSSTQQLVITEGFTRHSFAECAPAFEKKRFNWLAHDNSKTIVGALTADLLWDWLYIDELWTAESQRGQGLGRRLMAQAEQYALVNELTGVWLWTQSWQAADFYTHLGYDEFTRFDDFPKGHQRIGFRKILRNSSSNR